MKGTLYFIPKYEAEFGLTTKLLHTRSSFNGTFILGKWRECTLKAYVTWNVQYKTDWWSITLRKILLSLHRSFCYCRASKSRAIIRFNSLLVGEIELNCSWVNPTWRGTKSVLFQVLSSVKFMGVQFVSYKLRIDELWKFIRCWKKDDIITVHKF